MGYKLQVRPKWRRVPRRNSRHDVGVSKRGVATRRYHDDFFLSTPVAIASSPAYSNAVRNNHIPTNAKTSVEIEYTLHETQRTALLYRKRMTTSSLCFDCVRSILPLSVIVFFPVKASHVRSPKTRPFKLN